MTGTRTVSARRDPSLAARVVGSVPLLYADGAEPALDRPPHVRSASALAWIGGALCVVQDDAHFLALADPATGVCRALTLPAGEGGLRQFDDERGNKRFKLDLEACAAVPDDDGGEVLLAFGSGSTARRESILVVRAPSADEPRVQVIEAAAFYTALRETEAFAGSELNVEGAAFVDGRLVLVNRGNGAPSAGREPADAIGSVDWAALRAHLDHPAARPPPPVEAIVRYDLGFLGGSRLTFTDVAAAGGTLVFTATAEESPNAVDDGPVSGSAVGWIGAGGEATVVPLADADGTLVAEKVEGVAPGVRPGTLLLCTDPDAPGTPSRLLEVELSGGWPF